jgi:protein phosphatase
MVTKAHDADTDQFPALNDPLTRHFGPSPPPVRVTFGGLSDRGRVRENNEDHFAIIERRRSRTVLLSNLPEGFLSAADDTAYLYAVADGVGGHAFGELASMMALRSGWDQSTNAIKWTWIINDREVEDLKERVEIVFRRMDEALRQQARQSAQRSGMATTLTCAYTVGPEAFIAHVGDSRAYRYHGGKLLRLTRDHTLAQACLDAGQPVPHRSWHHMLTNCLGGSIEGVEVEFHHLSLADGDQLLLCTDGLTDRVRDEEIAAILGRAAQPQEVTQALVDLALERGGHDNVTVVLARYGLGPA